MVHEARHTDGCIYLPTNAYNCTIKLEQLSTDITNMTNSPTTHKNIAFNFEIKTLEKHSYRKIII